MVTLKKKDRHELDELPKRGRGRPKTDVEYKESKIRLLLDEWDHMNALAVERGYPFSVMVRVAVRKYIHENSKKKRLSTVR